MIAIGTQFYPAAADSDRRQEAARAALLRLEGVVPVNLQFTDDTFRPDGFVTAPVLRRDSRIVTGAQGVRKPIVSEMFDALSEIARARGCRYFAYLNADIEVTPAAIARIQEGDRDGYAFSRIDVDAVTGAEIGVEIFGLDLFAVDAGWWARERRRFRPYIVGEACWDNVYASLICAHGRGDIVNAQPGIYHTKHPVTWRDGPFAEHNGFLAALDSPYFSRWVRYATRLDVMRKGGTPGDESGLVEEFLSDPRLSAREAAVHAARQLRVRVSYARRKLTRGSRARAADT
jgi:hypothetical protein